MEIRLEIQSGNPEVDAALTRWAGDVVSTAFEIANGWRIERAGYVDGDGDVPEAMYADFDEARNVWGEEALDAMTLPDVVTAFVDAGAPAIIEVIE